MIIANKTLSCFLANKKHLILFTLLSWSTWNNVQVQAGFNSLPLFTCSTNQLPLYYYIGYGNVAYPRGYNYAFTYPEWVTKYNSSFFNECQELCLGGKQSCDNLANYYDSGYTTYIGCTDNVFYRFLSDVTYDECRNITYSKYVDPNFNLWGPYDHFYDDDEYKSEVWYQCGSEMSLTFLQKDFAAIYTESYNIVKYFTVSFFSIMAILESFLTGKNLSSNKEKDFSFKYYTDFLSILIKFGTSCVQLILFGYIYFSSMATIYKDFDCAEEHSRSAFRCIFIFNHMASPMFIPMLLDMANVLFFKVGIVLYIATMIVPVTLSCLSAVLALPAILIPLLPITLTHLLTIIIVVLLGCFAVVLVQLVSRFISLSISYCLSRIFFCIRRNEDSRSNAKEDIDSYALGGLVAIAQILPLVVIVVMPLSLMGWMTYVNEKFDPHYTGKNDGGKDDFETFSRFWKAILLSIYEDLPWTWKFIQIDWDNLSWIEIFGLPRIDITFSMPLWDGTFSDYFHTYMLSWTLKLLTFAVSATLNFIGKLLDGIFGCNQELNASFLSEIEMTSI